MKHCCHLFSWRPIPWIPGAMPLCLGLSFLISHGIAQNDRGAEPSWNVPSVESIHDEINQWLDKQGVGGPIRTRALQAFAATNETPPASQTLERLMRAAAIVDGRISDLINVCQSASRIGSLPEFSWLKDPSLAPLVRNNARLYYGRWLVQEEYYDEAIDVLGGLTTQDVIDPAGLLFYRSIAQHQLVDTERGREGLAMLLEREKNLSLRFQQLALLMQKDLSSVEPDSLDHIARRMQDIQRRLNKGRADAKVIEVEQSVLDSLDKLIDEIETSEKQRQQQQQPGQGQGNQPMQDSRPARMQAPGRVGQKPIGNRSGWGNLPDKEREEALQQVARDFPAHYRDVIEQYFRRLAAEEGSGQ
ncbi:MAG: hypothetical protein JW829_16670 [Pirellulales bacterium]|nr:hypothetical protein [Pirellulales bacterium]